MTAFADLEIGLYRQDKESYAIDMRFSQPDSDGDIRLLKTRPIIQINEDELRLQQLNPADYGKSLSDHLFSHPDVKSAFSQARVNAQTLNIPLRLRLFIDPMAIELHELRWETLCDPQEGSPLLTNEQILFSRYLSSFDWRPVKLLAKKDLSAVVVIANPSNLSDYQLPSVNVEGELERAGNGLKGIRLVTPESGERASLNFIIARLREGCDILYLACHGALMKGDSQLWLEDEDGKVSRTPGRELVTRIKELQKMPRLVVLVSCESAGTGNEERSTGNTAMSALGPRLAEAGIPAIIAMQGKITMETAARYMPIFFEELQRHGQIDQAMAAARGAVRDRPDWWMPVLFMRLKSGTLWYTPGFAADEKGLDKWPALINNIRQGRCTPILGSGLSEFFLCNYRDIALDWAESYHFPMAPQHKENLPQVAQFLAINQEYFFPRDKFREALREQLLKRYGDHISESMHQAPLDELIGKVCNTCILQDPSESHVILAGLPIPIYLTADPGNILETALRSAGKTPRTEICRWNQDIEGLPSIYDDDPDFQPTPDQPLVYHLFGILEEPESLVLTEDDYLDFLIGVTSNKDLIPNAVRRKLVDAALIFLGFHLDDWDFRVLFRSIISREGGQRRKKYAHVGVQVEPEQGRIIDSESARKYLEKYFQDSAISIFWGGSEDFLNELKRRM